jgi:CDP-glycerol glycerophosphotransferase
VSARVSVVVPFYNVAAYLEACLDSLAQQTAADLEVVMVDDGSTDASAEIAEAYAARDGRFRLVRQANAGLGAARNTGVTHASGEFVAFVDSDDVVPRHAYELLLETLDRTGSDFASGNVRRLTPVGTSKAGFLAAAADRTRLRTHITRFPPLLRDRTAWNKLFRRSFWDRHGFRFPVGVFYEDIPVTLPAHYLARTVDVIDQTVYLWRMREGDDLSITQRRTETKAVRDRVAAVDHVSRFLAEQGLPISKVLYDRSVLAADLRYFLDVLPIAGDEFRRLFLDLANEFIDRTHEWALDQPTAIERLKWQLVRRRALPELLEVLRFADEDLSERPPVRSGRGWYGDYPFRGDERLRLPESVFRLDDELAPVVRIDDVRWEGDKLRIEGSAHIGLLGAPTRDSQTVELVVRRAGGRRRKRVRAEPVHRPDVTAGSAQQFASLDWSGFAATLDTAKLLRGGRSPEERWEIAVSVRAGGVERTSTRVEPASLKAPPVAELSLPDGTYVWAGLRRGARLTVQRQRRPTVVRSYVLDQGVLQLEGEAGLVPGSAPTLEVRRRFGEATRSYPLYVDRSEPRTFLSRVPLVDLLEEAEVGEDAAHLEQQGEGVVWELFHVGAGVPQQMMLPESVPETTFLVGGREIAVRRARSGSLTLTERTVRPLLTDADWSPEGTLRLRGVFRAPEPDYELVLAARGRGATFAVPVARTGDGRFSAEVAPEAVPTVDGSRPLAEGVWDLLVREPVRETGAAVGVAVSGELLERLPLSGGTGIKPLRFGVDGGAPVLAVERELEDDERGGFAQRRLRTEVYPSKRTGRLRDAAVYICFGGTGYSDSPRALHEELVRRGAPLEHFWVVRDGAFAVPETAVPVRDGSKEYYELLGCSRYVVANDHWPRWFLRRPGQTCVQTWHGAPLKRLGLELAGRPKALRAHRRALAERPENWHVVVSPSSSATPVLERAFPADEVIETGLPRTDLLLQPDRHARAEELKRRLGVAGKRVVLYAPTYRDDLEYRPGSRVNPLRDLPTYRAAVARLDGYRLGHLLDLERLSSVLGEDDVVVFRKHRRVVENLPPEVEPYVLDASEVADGSELLLAADVLVTDYASLVFDFAATGRPIVFFTPDLEAYRDEVRGFSLDFEAEAPGPLLRTTDDVIDALRDLDAVVAESAERYAAFVASYCGLADGGASSRVVDRVFRW